MNGIKKLKKVALDSNVFIYNLEQNPHYVRFTDLIFGLLIANRLKAVTNFVTLTEILSYPRTEKVVREITEDFLNTPNLQVIEVGQEVAVEAARIRREYKFRLPDSIQLATALVAGSGAFITNDRRLKSFKKIPTLLLNQSDIF